MPSSFAPIALWFALLPVGHAAAADPVKVCFDESNPSALAYLDGDGRLQGAAPQLLRLALQRAGFEPEFVGLPWLRCKRELEEFGQRRGIELAMSASRSVERERSFLISVPLHVEHGGVWYRRATYPEGLGLKTRADLLAYQLCGVRGANYDWLRALGPVRLDQGALNIQAVLKKVEMQRCDAYPLSFEAAHLVISGVPFPVSEALAFEPYPDRSEFTKHVLVSRGSPRAEQLKAKLDHALTELHRSGEADQIYRRFLPSGTGIKSP